VESAGPLSTSYQELTTLSVHIIPTGARLNPSRLLQEPSCCLANSVISIPVIASSNL
jgi:hypothetical protein